MITGYQITDQSAIYFVTHTIVDWVDVFTRQRYRDIVIDSLKYCCEHKGLKTHWSKRLASSLAHASVPLAKTKKYTFSQRTPWG
jgi:hypothetical protein